MTAQGKWDITIKTPMGVMAGVLTLAVDGANLTGSLSNAEHDVPISNGKVQGNSLSWSASLKKPVAMTFKFTATVDADRIGGVAKHFLGKAEFSGRRSQNPLDGVAGPANPWPAAICDINDPDGLNLRECGCAPRWPG